MSKLVIYDTYFLHDWNTREGQKEGKLQCSCFTTLRPYGVKWAVGAVHRIWNNHSGKAKCENLGYAVVIRQIPFYFCDLEKNDVLCRLDTGFGWERTAGELQGMYNNTLKSDTLLNFALLRYLTKAEIVALTERLKTDSEPTIL
jgi:hypothetical protein